MHDNHIMGSFFAPPNLVDLVRHRARHQADDLAFLFLADGETDERPLTYRELDERASAIAAELQVKGFSGERALLLYPAGLDFITAFFGCLYAGAVAVPAYPPRRNRSVSRIEAIVEDAQPKLAMTTSDVLDRVRETIAETDSLRALHWETTDTVSEESSAKWSDPNVEQETLAFLQYTSGSTGTPKGVMLSHGNLIHNSALISYAFEHTRSRSGVFWLPSYHDMGLIGGILQPLYVGRPNVLMSPMAFLQKPLRWLRAISRYRGSTSGGPNFAYDLCVEKITPEQRETLDLSCWKVAFNGAEPVRPETLDRFSAMFEPCGFRREAFYPCYGLAESTLIVSGGLVAEPPVTEILHAPSLEDHRAVATSAEDPHARGIVGCGKSMWDQRLEIVDPETQTPLLENSVGEIWVSSPSVATGYWNRPDESERTFRAKLKGSREMFLRTGDLGFIRNGELFVTGRLKDLIIVRGRNVYPQDVEWTVARSHADLRSDATACFAIDENGEEGIVIVQEVVRSRKSDFEPLFDAVRRAVGLEHELLPLAIVFVQAGSIPKTSSGKIQRHACRDGFVAGTLSEVARWIPLAHQPNVETAARQSAPLPKAVESPENTQPPQGQTLAVAPHRNGISAHAPLEDSRETREIVVEHVRRVAKERARGLTLETPIPELGLDSLERMEIVASLEDTFGGRFPEQVLHEMLTCRDVIAAVDRYLRPAQGECDAPGSSTDRALGAEAYHFEQFPEYLRFRRLVDQFAHLNVPSPFFPVHEGISGHTAHIDGTSLINFSNFNYVGMAGDPEVARAAKEAIDRYGTSAAASRLVSGEKPIHGELEQRIAEFLGTESALVFPSGHATNETTLGHLFGPGDLILHDGLAHNSMSQGAKLSGARVRPFAHNDWEYVDAYLAKNRGAFRRVGIALDAVYSMDGDIAALPGFLEVKKRHHAFLYIDEAHSLGVLGLHGRGISEHFGINPREVDFWMGTLSKSLGAAGGYIAGPANLVEYLKFTTPGFVFATALPPMCAAAANMALRLLEEEPQRVARLAENSRRFLSLARKQGLNTGLSHGTAVVPVIIGDSLGALQSSHRLRMAGFNVQPIMYPAVGENEARLRYFISSLHTTEQIEAAVNMTAEIVREIHPTAMTKSSPRKDSVPITPGT